MHHSWHVNDSFKTSSFQDVFPGLRRNILPFGEDTAITIVRISYFFSKKCGAGGTHQKY